MLAYTLYITYMYTVCAPLRLYKHCIHLFIHTYMYYAYTTYVYTYIHAHTHVHTQAHTHMHNTESIQAHKLYIHVYIINYYNIIIMHVHTSYTHIRKISKEKALTSQPKAGYWYVILILHVIQWNLSLKGYL